MSVEFELDGLEELRQELLKLPYELTQEAAERIAFRTAVANTQIGGRYAQRSGRLRRGLRVKVEIDGASVVGTVTNTSKLAYIYENGTQARHTDTGALRGAMPPGHAFIPIMAQQRRLLYAELKEIVARAGLEVSGDA